MRKLLHHISVLFQFMMSNKLARLFVFAYSVLLHLLVFLVLMRYLCSHIKFAKKNIRIQISRFAYVDSYRRDLASEWHEKYLQHMEDAHGHEQDAAAAAAHRHPPEG